MSPVKAPQLRAFSAALHTAPAARCVLAAVQEEPAAIASARTSLDPVEPIGLEQRNRVARDVPTDDVETVVQLPPERRCGPGESSMRHRLPIRRLEFVDRVC